MGGDDRHRKSKKSSKHRSSRDSGHRDGRSRDHKSRDNQDDGRGDRESKKLTEEEEKLYAKAREYLEKEKEEKGGHRKRHRHEKDSKRRRGRSESSDSSDSSRRDRKRSKKESKRSRGDDDRHKKSSRHKKKSKRSQRDDDKHKHSHGKKHGSKSEPSFKDKASKIDASKLVTLGTTAGEPPTEQLDAENSYFSHNSHLRLYLYRQYGIYFEELTSSESHDAFKEFAKAYNEGTIEEAYYNSPLPQEALDQCSRTKHQWKFRVNKTEEHSLDVVRAGVKKQTEYSDAGGAARPSAAAAAAVKNRPQLPARPEEDGNSHRRKTPQELAAQRQSDKRHRERLKLANEELHGVGGKADHGFERKLQKRREHSEKLHGAARDRESEACGGAELDDDAIYGSAGVGRGRGETSFGDAVAKERRYRERKEAEKAARTSELLKKEEEKQKKMFEALGLTGIKAGQKIQIAPRNDSGK